MKYFIAILALTTACCGPIMTPCIYDEAQIGDSIEQVTACAGEPYYICESPDSCMKQYVYISRKQIVPNIHQHKNWIFLVDEDGCILDKYICDDEFQEEWFFLREDDFDRLP